MSLNVILICFRCSFPEKFRSKWNCTFIFLKCMAKLRIIFPASSWWSPWMTYLLQRVMFHILKVWISLTVSVCPGFTYFHGQIILKSPQNKPLFLLVHLNEVIMLCVLETPTSNPGAWSLLLFCLYSDIVFCCCYSLCRCYWLCCLFFCLYRDDVFCCFLLFVSG